MALALYRKYRPRTFAEVIGQEHVTEPLSQALRSGRLNHAYLFSGPRGCGKTSSARILARSLNCEQGPTPEPCGVCTSCRSLANDGTGSIDVIEIDAASHGGVDDARELREKAFFAPANSRYKIYVIDEAHMVSSAGFNALLKLVEEPPEYVKFIFATTEPDKVLGTIRSRTHHYPFRLIPPPVLRPYLQQLTDAEGVTVEPSVFPLVVRAGGGSARDSLSILDQLIAGSGPEGVTYHRAVALLGVTDVTLIDEMCDALATGDGAAAYATIDRVAEAGHEPRRFASDLLERLRDLIILQQVPDAVAKGLIDGPADQLEAMARQADRLGAATLSRCADILHDGLVDMRGTTAPRLLLELLTARMLLPGAEASSAALLQRLERLERGVTLTPSAPVAASGPASAPIGAAGPSASDEVRGEHPPASDASRGAAAGGGAGGGAKAAAMAAARAASSRPGPAVVRPVSPAAPASSAAEAVPAPSAAQGVPTSPAAQGVPASPAAQAVPAPAVPAPAAQAVPAQAAGGQADSPAPSGVQQADVAGSEPDWNGVADGRPHPGAAGPVEDDYDEEPPWEDEPPAPQVSGFDRVRAVWERLGQNNQRVSAAQSHGVALGRVDGQDVIITAPTAGLVARMRNLNELLADEFASALGGRWQVRCEVGDPPGSGPARGTSGNNRSGGANRAHTAAPERNAGPERNTGRSEPRPSRPAQRGPSADADDDWPAARPPAPGDPARVADGQGPATAGRPSTGPSGGDDWPAARPPASGDPARVADGQGPATAGRPSTGPSGGDDGWPDPARPPQGGGEAWRAPSPDSGRPEPARPSATDRPAQSAHQHPDSSAAGGDGWPEPARPPAPVSGGAGAGESGWPEPVRPPASALGASGAGEGGWPETARPPASADRSGGSRPGDPVRAGSAAGDDSWPEPVRPGGGRSGSPAPASASNEWPEPARPGNPAASAGSGASAGGVTTGPFVGSVGPSVVPGASPASTGHPSASAGDPGVSGGHPAATAGSPGTSGGHAAAAAGAAGAPAGIAGARAAVGAGPSTTGATARPVGGAVGGGSAFGGAAVPATPASARSVAPAVPARPAAPGAPARSAAMEAARAAARTGKDASGGGAAAARAVLAGARGAGPARPAAGGSSWSDGSPTEEAPYDPEYDGPPPSGAGFDGFDPGDEPLDDVIDEKTARQSSEEQAMQLLRAAFGAEKIGEL
ncbi:DNA polymerase III subunit gamma and tau [Actinoplanes flavus]|uniref:DNA-directed DNA polymerase n=1 Tax=Actinoplanes flavus TaxID=2820290 RepID=A0ABS3ULE3_9ACTN|nr:DNA polymerase III subunit gamma and tau [Actinoplanes flavus]MBO3739605.1 DNA polymerase III subunit gamma and tau [Actinoplanes flavus]